MKAFALLFGLAGLCDGASADDLSGHWKFRTQPASGACVLDGDMQIDRAGASSAYSCQFKVRTECAFATPQFQVVEESCSISRRGAEVVILSKVGKVTDAGPPAIRSFLMSPGEYLADDFTVRLDAKSGDLIGVVRDPVRRGPVRFWRKKEITS